MKRFFPAIAALLLLACAGQLSGSEKTKIGIFDLTSYNVPAATATAVSEILGTELFNTGRFTIVDRKNMDKILKEQAFQRTGCTTTDCAVEVGRILNINNMVIGSLSKLGNTYKINIQLVDVEKGEVITANDAECSSEDKLSEAATRLAVAFSQSIPVIGKIVRAGEDEVVIDLGTVDNVSAGMKFLVNRLKEDIKDTSGNIIMKEWEDVGHIELTEVQKQASKARVIDKKKLLTVGDVVRIGELAGAKKETIKIGGGLILPQAAQYTGTGGGSFIDPLWRSMLIPGWGQFYNKDDFKGWLFTIGGIGSGALAIKRYMDSQSLYDTYNKETDTTKIESDYQAANNANKDAQGMLGLFAVIWGLNVLDSVISFDPSKHVAAIEHSGPEVAFVTPEKINIGYKFTW